MFSFFTALFGGAYYSGRYVHERFSEIDSNSRNYTYRTIVARIQNSDLETKMRKLLANSEDKKKEVLKEISDDLQYVFGDEWEIKYIKYSGCSKSLDYSRGGNDSYTYGFFDIWELVFHIWMSRQGYISVRASQGYNINAYIVGADNKEESEYIARRACRIIEKNLQKKHEDIVLKLTGSLSLCSKLTWWHWLSNIGRKPLDWSCNPFEEEPEPFDNNRRRKVYNSIEKQITNFDFEQEARKAFINSKDKKNEILTDILDDLQYIFGDSWESQRTTIESLYKADSVNPISCVTHYWGFYSICELVFNIWLSKQGYIVKYGHGYNIKEKIDGFNQESFSEEVARRACRIIEKNLQKKHEDIVLKLWIDSTDVNSLTWEHWLDYCDTEPLARVRPW